MPELPEVEIFKRFIDRHALNQGIQRVTVRHPKGLRDLSPEVLQCMALHHCFNQTLRRGKYLMAKLEPVMASSPSRSEKPDDCPAQASSPHRSPWLLFHFGMTGCLSYTSAQGQSVNAYGDGINRDAHIRVSFEFADGGQLHFHDQRLFGYISAVDNPRPSFRPNSWAQMP